MKLNVLLVCSILMFSVIVPAGDALGCSCARPESPCAALDRSGAVVFAGTALEVSSPTNAPGGWPGGGRVVRVRFSVDEAFRDAFESTDVISTPEQSSMCGYEFQAGESYLVFAYRTPEGLVTSTCSRTALLAAARDDVELLREAGRGEVRSRLHGAAVLLMARMDGTLVPGVVEGLPHIKVVARGGSGTHRTTTDVTGEFKFIGLEPGRYTLRAEPEAPLKPSFDREVAVELDAVRRKLSCS